MPKSTTNTQVTPQIDFRTLSVMGPPHTHSRCCWCHAALRPVCDGKFWRCPTTACFTRQRQYWVVGATAVLFIPTPIQTVLFEAVAPLDAAGNVLPSPYLNILFGGSRGSSKSFALRWLAHWLCLKLPGFQVLMLRRTLPELDKSQLKNIRLEAPLLNAVLNSKYELAYPTTSQMTFGHCAEVGDEAKYLSSAYDLIIFDEETTFETTQILDISTSARPSERTPKGWNPLVVGGTNPGGIAGPYCKGVYVSKMVDPAEYPDYTPSEYLYIQSMLEDNPFLDTAEYEKNLKKLGPLKYKLWRMADWDATEDQFFGEFRKQDITDDHGQIHIAHATKPEDEPDTHTIERFCSLHWGLKMPGVCYWWCCLLDGTFYIEDEYRFEDTLAKYVATEILRRNTRRKITIRHVVAGDELWNRRGQTGESLVETFRTAGLPMVRSKHDRVIGWNRVRALLDDNEDGIPWLRFSKTRCPSACLTIPALMGDPTHPEDIIRTNDMCANAIRYGAMSRPYPTRKTSLEIPREALKGKAGYWRYELEDEPRHHYGGDYWHR
jgi:phage terminase large subunit